MPCPICGRVMCDCTPGERGQSQEEMMGAYAQDVDQLRKKQTKKGAKSKKKK